MQQLFRFSLQFIVLNDHVASGFSPSKEMILNESDYRIIIDKR